MKMITMDDFRDRVSSWLANDWASDGVNWKLRLFSNNHTPAPGDAPGAYTSASFTGYAEISLSAGTWVAAGVVAHIAYILYDSPVSFTCGGGSPQDIYGFWIYDSDANTVILAQKFDTPKTVVPDSTLALDPFRIALDSIT